METAVRNDRINAGGVKLIADIARLPIWVPIWLVHFLRYLDTVRRYVLEKHPGQWNAFRSAIISFLSTFTFDTEVKLLLTRET